MRAKRSPAADDSGARNDDRVGAATGNRDSTTRGQYPNNVEAEARAIWIACAPIEATAGQAYLAGRGIDRLPTGVARWQVSSPALVFAATAPDGQVQAVQRLFFDARGKPLLEKSGEKRRRTNGVLRNAALTLPGEGDLLICEGAEDALSLWLATGRPVLAAFGASHLANIPVTLGKPIIIVADNDGPGRKVARKAAQALVAKGHAVSIAIPPDNIKDANELLVGRGEEAVRALVSEASPFTFERNEASPEPDEPSKKKRAPTQAEILLRLAEAAELFHSPDSTAYADVVVADHRQTHAIRSKGFKHWLAWSYHQETGAAVSSEARECALGALEAKAMFGAPEREVHVRVAGLPGQIYIDLGDATWRAVEIDANGWRLVDAPPVRFRRAKGVKPLPAPQATGSIEQLRRFLNVKSDSDFVLIVCWLLSCLRPRGPYPLLVLSGEQGSAKSTLCTLLRALIDPNTAGLRTLPREDRDLFIAATNGHLLCFDNLSALPAGVSDTFCRLATGGGFAVRSLYTDGDETLFNESRPVLLNGISDIATRPDLAERAIFLTLQPISESSRRPEEKLLAEFEAARAQIIGALLTWVAEGLSRLEHTKIEKLPRMADFALWATACESAFWPDGTFAQAYDANRDDALSDTLEADPVAMAVKTLLEKLAKPWIGTATELLTVLNAEVGDQTTRSKTWPGTAKVLSSLLRRAAPILRRIGINADFGDGKKRPRVITISFMPPAATPEPEPTSAVATEGFSPSGPSAASEPTSNHSSVNELGPDAKPDVKHAKFNVASDAKSNEADASDVPCVGPNLLKTKAADATDATDAKIPTQSARDGATSAQSRRLAAARRLVEKSQDLGIGLHEKNGELLRKNVWVDESFLSEIREHKAEIITVLQGGWGA
jgi:phage/plasmid primase-like uncharacterized protein